MTPEELFARERDRVKLVRGIQSALWIVVAAILGSVGALAILKGWL